jgi:hypothetical protein
MVVLKNMVMSRSNFLSIRRRICCCGLVTGNVFSSSMPERYFPDLLSFPLNFVLENNSFEKKESIIWIFAGCGFVFVNLILARQSATLFDKR